MEILNLQNLILAGIFLFFLIFIVVSKQVANGKKLKEDLLQYGVETYATVEKRVGSRIGSTVYIKFEYNGQTIRKICNVMEFWFQQKETYPILLDPNNPNRFLFNTKKFDLRENSGEDSVGYFLKKREAYPRDFTKSSGPSTEQESKS